VVSGRQEEVVAGNHHHCPLGDHLGDLLEEVEAEAVNLHYQVFDHGRRAEVVVQVAVVVACWVLAQGGSLDVAGPDVADPDGAGPAA
jgi:hypothetical protein